MRLDKLWIGEFKNLIDFKIDFDESQLTTVFIGRNGTGKSNVFEAIIKIFLNLDLGKPPEFSYILDYILGEYTIRIDANAKNSTNHSKIIINKRPISYSNFVKNKRKYMPAHIFAYYSGPSSRLESLFDYHQEKFSRELRDRNRDDIPIRPFFYARNIHSQFVLLSFFSFPDEGSKKFLDDYLNISGLESILFILKEPNWRSRYGDKRFWNARGVVQEFLSELYKNSLAPMRRTETKEVSYNRRETKEYLYLFIPSEIVFTKFAKKYGNNKDFFKVLESTYISELLDEVRIKVKIKNSKSSLTFTELSDGEQQLLTVLGLLRFTKESQSLFLLDEPDTHLNPAWKLDYLNLIEQVVGKFETSQIIICTHDPLTIGGLLRNQVQFFEKDYASGRITTHYPDLDPKGMGVAALLTSELFGLNTTLDLDTQKKLDRKRELFLKTEKTEEEIEEMETLSEELGSLDFTRTIRDPLYDKFVRAMMARDEFKKPTLTYKEKKNQEKIAKEIIDDLLEEE